ncbi:NlpC/P60 family protein [Galactobacter sp.]|uniref:C40 family peptidase n=1 Tax=Galactobacter sp. TaxID=2676125 RepID=UPI0025BCB525|nr:NlpC/P60 family protein [Galactobacter sp.]
MTKRVEAARHRAVSTGTFDQLSKAVAGNAGTMSRQAAVVAAAGGLVVTLGVSGSTAASKTEAAPKADSNTTSLDIQRVASTEIHAAPVKKAPKTGSLVKVVAKPAAPERSLAQGTVIQPAAPAASETNERTLPQLERTVDTTPATTASDSASNDSESTSNDSESTSSASDSSSATKTAEQTAAKPSVNNSSIVSTAMSYTGSPYVHGGTTPAGWDCVGFVSYVLKQHGYSVSNSYGSILSAGRQVPYSQVQAGDILVWPGRHAAISTGGSSNVGAWQPGMGTKVGPNSWISGTPTVIRVGA